LTAGAATETDTVSAGVKSSEVEEEEADSSSFD